MPSHYQQVPRLLYPIRQAPGTSRQALVYYEPLTRTEMVY